MSMRNLKWIVCVLGALAGAAQAQTVASAASAASEPTASFAAVSASAASAPPATTVQKTADASGGSLPYVVVDGTKVGPETMKGFRLWRQSACDRCHGANQEGLVGPSLLNSLKTLSKDDFIKTVQYGRLEKGMPNFGNNPAFMDNVQNLYGYLKGRSDGAITKSKVEEIKQ